MNTRPYCDDWQCPAAVSCALHYGRSSAYAAMRAAPVERRDRDPKRDSCADYEFDRPKAWLGSPARSSGALLMPFPGLGFRGA